MEHAIVCEQYEDKDQNVTSSQNDDTTQTAERLEPTREPRPQKHYLDLAMYLQNKAYESLRGKWESAIGVYLISIICLLPWYYLSALTFMFMEKRGLGASFFITSLLLWGSLFLFVSVLYYGFYNSAVVAIRKDEQFKFSSLFMGFKSIDYYGKVVWQFIVTILFLFLWYLLLVIPGIIKSYSYAMVIFIRRDYPELSATEVIALSEKMMQGHKLDLFVLTIFFMFWNFLGLFTCYIGYLWIVPFMITTLAQFYEHVKADYLEEQKLYDMANS